MIYFAACQDKICIIHKTFHNKFQNEKCNDIFGVFGLVSAK